MRILFAFSAFVALASANLQHTESDIPGFKVEIISNANEKQGAMNPKTGDQIVVHYDAYFEDGTKFDSSRDRGSPFSFVLGRKAVIDCWERAIPEVKIGQKAKITCPPELAYGSHGAGSVVPPDTTILFDMDLLSNEDAEWLQS